jgi:hypothetical protein
VRREPAGYGSPGAFRRALTDRLHAIAAASRWTLPHLQRQFAYDRLLERLYAVDDGWIVKGAAALLARDLGVRATIDVDVYRARVREVAEPNCAKPPARTSATGSGSRSAPAVQSAMVTKECACRRSRLSARRSGRGSTSISSVRISA